MEINPIVELFEFDMEKGIWKFFDYGFRNCGGLFWPLLYGVLIFNSWIALNEFGRYIFVTLGMVMVCLGILYPYAWSKYYRRYLRNINDDYVKMIKNNSYNLLEKIRSMYPMENPYQKEMMNLSNSLRTFENRYFPKKEE